MTDQSVKIFNIVHNIRILAAKKIAIIFIFVSFRTDKNCMIIITTFCKYIEKEMYHYFSAADYTMQGHLTEFSALTFLIATLSTSIDFHMDESYFICVRYF